MTVQEFYEKTNGDYEGVLGRLQNDEKIKRFCGMFLRDESFDLLCRSMEEKDYETAFRAVHTLKGVCQNLGFAGFFVPVDHLTETLRNGECTPEALEQFEVVKEQYGVIRKAIEEL